VFVIGAILLSVAVAYHVREILVLNQRVGPIIALLLDGTPALGLSYAAYRLEQSSLSESDLWRTVAWSLAGAIMFISVIALTFLVLVIEGRPLVEPIFLVLITVDIGALAGITAGYYHARARAETRRVSTVNTAVAFVNDLIRHDLRNDLSVIQAHADLINSETVSGEDGSGMVDVSVIEDKTEEALSRIETTRAITETLVRDSEFERVDLSQITVDLVDKIEDIFPGTITTSFPDEVYVQGNAGVWSVVDNVLENAARHNDADDPWIDVEIESQDDQVILRVSDNGPGIPDQEKPDGLEADEENFEAHGLTLVHTLVDAYDGQLMIEDNEPRGTIVSIYLPRADINGGSPTA
jgi:signal transduction histidine kinase